MNWVKVCKVIRTSTEELLKPIVSASYFPPFPELERRSNSSLLSA